MAKARKEFRASYQIDFKTVLDLCFKDKFIDEVSYHKLVKRASIGNDHPLEVISQFMLNSANTNKSTYSLEGVCKWFAAKHNMPYLKVDPMKLNMDACAAAVSHAYANRLQIIPINVSNDEIHLLTCDPYNTEWVEEIKRTTRKEVKLFFGSPKQIKNLLDEIFVVQKAFKDISRNRSHEEKQAIRAGNTNELNRIIELSQRKDLGGMGDSVVQIATWLLNFASMERTSDIHIEPKKGMGEIRFRVDGKLRTVQKLPPETIATIIARFKILGSLKIDEKRLPQDGQAVHYIGDHRVELRLSTIPTQFGEKLVIRIFDKQIDDLGLDFIGFTPEDQKVWESLVNTTQGFVLVTGPTGSGKSTTLYSTLLDVSNDDINVMSAEDPIEMTIDTVNQVQINPSIGLTFSTCMRSFLRQDPDIIMVGEIRDRDTAEMAIQASLTGHLVFSTVHTNGAIPTINRLIDLGVPAHLINSSLTGVLAQRLVRKLCPDCKQEIETPKALWESLTHDIVDTQMPKTVFKPVGCDSCKDTGFIGRFCVYEILKIDSFFRDLISEKVTLNDLTEKSKGRFKTIRHSACEKVAAGDTSIEEVLKIVY